MLVLTRKTSEKIIVNNEIVITVVEIRGNRVKLGIIAPTEVPVMREEIAEKLRQHQEAAAR